MLKIKGRAYSGLAGPSKFRRMVQNLQERMYRQVAQNFKTHGCHSLNWY